MNTGRKLERTLLEMIPASSSAFGANSPSWCASALQMDSIRQYSSRAKS